MTERGMLFSAPMVRALLAGTKTQTRRIVKLRGRDPSANKPGVHAPIVPYTDGRGSWNFVLAVTGHGCGDPFPCPYGQPGDRLWVRETWRERVPDQDGNVDEYRADFPGLKPVNDPGPPWTPSIHMPRAASRIDLEVVDVRVERLQDISEADAIAEGVHPDPRGRDDDDFDGFVRVGSVRGDSFPIARYAALWESINGPGSWGRNPWVWVVSFRRIKP